MVECLLAVNSDLEGVGLVVDCNSTMVAVEDSTAVNSCLAFVIDCG